ncbi:MAG: hypothetical protein K0Q79_2926 [Flavipsychrobacter sp.]|jgi:hypothetical protein|nr:hypothetical protein [Flavipsychrobacter sp.]
MKKYYAIICLLLIAVNGSFAQSFRKGSLLVSFSEGVTYTKYTTAYKGDGIKQGNVTGERDPLTVEYGLTDRWGIGMNLGGDIFNINSASYYNFESGETNNKAKVITSEITADIHYHFFVTKRTDLSLFTSVGIAGVTIEGKNGDAEYKYNAAGGIIRSGAQARYYFWKRFGALAMVSAYTSQCSTDAIKDNTVGHGISTNITGFAWELGIQYRILK